MGRNESVNPDVVKRFHGEMVDLIKKYQFRDRNEMASCGMSVSQCYLLETLHRFGPLPMQDLADKMHLAISTVTRVVAPLVRKKLVNRGGIPHDQRVRIIELTERGRGVFLSAWKGVMQSEMDILESFPENRRDMLVELLQKLNESFGNRKSKRSRE